jgi:hypothetical protein
MHLDRDVRIDAVEAEIRLIERMPLPELRALWVSRWGFAPRFRSVDLLRRLIAWRLQAELFGGLDAEATALLRGATIPRPPGPPRGSRLTREYRGINRLQELTPRIASRRNVTEQSRCHRRLRR